MTIAYLHIYIPGNLSASEFLAEYVGPHPHPLGGAMCKTDSGPEASYVVTLCGSQLMRSDCLRFSCEQNWNKHGVHIVYPATLSAKQ